MKIVVATSTAFHLRYLAVQLLDRGHDMTFISYLPRFKTVSYGLPASATRSLFMRLQPGASLALLRGGGQRLHAIREHMLLATDRAIARSVPPCDVFIGLSAVTVASAEAARKRHGATVIIERGSAHVEAQQRLLGGRLSRFYMDRELASYAVADRIVVPSAFAYQSFLAEGVSADRLATIPLGVDVDRFHPAADAPTLPVKMLFVGAWSRQKGADLLVEAVAAIPGVHLTHVGKRVDVPFPDDSRFTSLGYLDHAALSREMTNHHLLVLPSRQDGFGMVMTEALAAGLRVVASDATGGPDLATLLPRHVTVCPAGSASALTSALRHAITAIESDPVHFRPQAGEIDQLSWHRYGDRYAAFLQSL